MVPAIRQAWARLVGTFLIRHPSARNRIFAARDRALNSHIPPAGDPKANIRRRKGRANAGFSRKVSVIRDWGNCVVADAVGFEPVSSLQFGKCRVILRKCREEQAQWQLKAVRSQKFE